jgi:hypothetical protein
MLKVAVSNSAQILACIQERFGKNYPKLAHSSLIK